MELKEHNQTQLTQDLPQQYNDEPVHYCTECLSLKVRVYSEKMDYCDECGSTDIKQTHITEWEKMYETKYKQNFLDINSIKGV